MKRERAIAEPDLNASLDDGVPDRDSSSWTRVGEFTLRRRLGRGAQGEVYEARQESLGRLVALKILPPHMTFHPERVQRFRREAEAGGRLDHPNTVGVYSVGEQDGCHYIAQELVVGGHTLGDRIAAARQAGELPRDWYETTAQLFVKVADAVDAAHGSGIIHRDLKPGNILLTRDGTPKVADFGLAMVEDDLHRSVSGELVGTPFYMSPEQGSGSRTGLDKRTDVFSLGVTLYETLTLERPFDAETRDKIVALIQSKEARDPRKVRHGVPRDLALICMKALEKRRDRRYQTAGALADDLRRFLAHEPIRARAPGRVVRAVKWVRRHPVLTGFVLTYALVVVLLGVYWRENRRVVERDGRLTTMVDQLSGVTKSLISQSLLDPAGFAVDGPQPRPAPGAPIVADIDGALRVAAQLQDFPDERWYLLANAGAHLRNLSLFERAEPVLEDSLEAAHDRQDRDEYGPERVARSSFELARLYRWTGRSALAEPLLRDARTIMVERFGAASEPAFGPTLELAKALNDQKRTDEALALLTDLHAGLDGEGDEHQRKLQTAQVIGVMAFEAGRLDEAEAWLVPAYEQSAGVTPEVERCKLSASVARLFGQRGLEARKAKRIAEADDFDRRAEAAFATAIDGLEAQLPAHQLTLARVQSDAGVFLRKRDRFDEARAVLESSLHASLLLAGPDAAPTLTARANLASALNSLGDVAGAEAQLLEVIAADRRGPDADRAAVTAALASLASLYCNQDRLAEAAPLAEEAVSRSELADRDYEKRVGKLAEIKARIAAKSAPSTPSATPAPSATGASPDTTPPSHP